MKATVTLPWADKILSPNARAHWSKKYKATKAAKNAAFLLTKNECIGKIDADKINIKLIFNPPTKRNRDADNAIASMKSSLDGIALSLGVDDSLFIICGASFGPVIKYGSVTVLLEW